MKKLKDILLESFNRKLNEQQDINIGGYTDPGHTYSYNATNQTVLKKNSAGKAVATYKKENNAWKWVEGNKQLSNNLNAVFNKAIGTASDSAQTSSTDQTQSTDSANRPPDGLVVQSKPKVLKLPSTSATPVDIQVTGDNVLVYDPKSTFKQLDAVTDIFVDATQGDSPGMLGSLNPMSGLKGLTTNDINDLINNIAALSKVNIRTADFKKDKWNQHIVDNTKEFVPLLAVINNAYYNEEKRTILDSMNMIINGQITGEDSDTTEYKNAVQTLSRIAKNSNIIRLLKQTL